MEVFVLKGAREFKERSSCIASNSTTKTAVHKEGDMPDVSCEELNSFSTTLTEIEGERDAPDLLLEESNGINSATSSIFNEERGSSRDAPDISSLEFENESVCSSSFSKSENERDVPDMSFLENDVDNGFQSSTFTDAPVKEADKPDVELCESNENQVLFEKGESFFEKLGEK